MNRFKFPSRVGVILSVVVALALAAFPRNGFAQVNPLRLGMWKLNVAKSKYSPGLPPRNQTRKDEAAGDGVKATFEGIAGDGSRIAYSYTAKYVGSQNLGTPLD